MKKTDKAEKHSSIKNQNYNVESLTYYLKGINQ
jgi:hypothetical protein